MRFKSYLLNEAGLNFERQERALIDAINDSVKQSKKDSITVKTSSVVINNVVSSEKYPKRTASGNKPLTDIVILKKKGEKQINVSCKGTSSPSLAGGGADGIETIIPGFLKKYLNFAVKELKAKKFKTGDKAPDLYFKMDKNDTIALLKGNEATGGPIDYIYKGSMDAQYNFDVKTNTLSFTNGELIPIEKFLTHTAGFLYLRMRKRREDQLLDLELTDRHGYPRIFGKSAKGDVGVRVVVTDTVSSQALVY